MTNTSQKARSHKPVKETEAIEESAEVEQTEAAGEDAEEYEELEIEFDEDDIVGYLVDEEGNEIGFTLLDEDGTEVEYFYVEDEGDSADSGSASTGARSSSKSDNEYDPGITKKLVSETTKDMNAIYKDGMAVATELKDVFTDIKSALDFKSFLKK